MMTTSRTYLQKPRISGVRGHRAACGKILSEIPSMHTNRRLLLLFLAFSLAVLSLPVFAQQVIATIPVGSRPYTEAINPVTNKIYIANACGNDFGTTCAYPFSPGTVTVVDGTTLNTQLVNVGYLPYGVAVNPVTNKIYIANQCGDDSACAGNGTVTVIDGATLATTTVTVESNPYGVAVNSVTNKIYAVNGRGAHPCATARAPGWSVLVVVHPNRIPRLPRSHLRMRCRRC